MQVVLVFPLLLLLTAFLSWFAGYATHYFLHVLNETAQGRNDVRIEWPSDGYYERLWNAAYLAGLWAVILFPSLLLARFPELLSGGKAAPVLVEALIVAAAVWLLLPIPFLSVLSGRHHWEIFRWKVVRAFARNAAIVGAFYAASAPLIIGSLLVAHFAVIGWMEFQEAAETSTLTWLPDALKVWSWLFVLPLAGAYCAATLLIYARLLGRLAWLLDLAEEEEEEEPRPKEQAIPIPSDLVASHDALEHSPSDASVAVETYGLREEEPDTVLPAGPIPERELPFSMTTPAARPLEPLAPLALASTVERVQPSPILEVPEKKPARRRLLVRGIFLYPWYRGSLVAWSILTMGFLVVLLLARLMVMVLQ